MKIYESPLDILKSPANVINDGHYHCKYNERLILALQSISFN